MMAGLRSHFFLTLRLNFRSPQALVYGYAVPVLFLVGFAAAFPGDSPPLQHEMGQLLTITLLGGACFGLPTALVAERERGVWQRYRLLPIGTGWLLVSVLAARLVLVLGAVLLQILLASAIYHTPLPLHPGELVLALLVASAAFLGWGLIVAALADDVPAVQALGQCLFLPMILVGGVGVPLAVLPGWAQRLSGFMPGRYAVQVLQACTGGQPGLRGLGFPLAALLVIGAAAGLAGVKLIRWDRGRRLDRAARGWLLLAGAAWIAIGTVAATTGRLDSVLPYAAWQDVSDAQIQAIAYDDVPSDADIVTRLAPPFDRDPAGAARVADFAARLQNWAPAHDPDAGQAVRNLLCLAANADVSQDVREGEIARVVFNRLQSDFDRNELPRLLAWVILTPDDGTLVMDASALGLRRHPPAWSIKARNRLYAKKFLGRLLGKLPD